MLQFQLQPVGVSILHTKEKLGMFIRRQPRCGYSVNNVTLQIVQQSYANCVTSATNINGPKIHILL